MKKFSYLIINNEEDEEILNINKKNEKVIQKRRRRNLKERLINKNIINKITLIKCSMFLILIFFLISLVILVISSQYHKYINNLNKIIFDTIYENKDQINKQNNINNSTNINNNSLINNDTNNNNNKNKTSENQENIQKSGIPSKNESNQDKFIDYKFPSLKDSFNKAKPFIDKCAKLIFINDKTKFNSSEKPKASAIIPVYNSQNLIHRAIKSIQNQNLLDIEIILVNDFSTDKSLSVIESIQKEDPRIKIIKNKKNMGI